MRLIGVRVDGDAGAEAGMGHVYRSIAYGREIERAFTGVTVRFYMRDFPEGINKVRRAGFAVSILPRRPMTVDFASAFKDHPPDLLIIDTLGSSPDLVACAKERSARVISLDDLNDCARDVDVVVNGIVWATEELSDPFGRARVYQGVDYVQLRKQFVQARERPRSISRSVANILVSTGGADGRSFAPQFMRALADLRWDGNVWIMAGPGYHNVPELSGMADAASGRVRFTVIQDTADMARYLSTADLAVITGGTVMFEAAVCGTPAIVVCSHEHQVPQANWFAEQGVLWNLGYAREIDVLATKAAVEGLARDFEQRQRFSERGRRVVDAYGLRRFVQIISEVIG